MICEALHKAAMRELSAAPKTARQVFRNVGPWWTEDTVREALDELVQSGVAAQVQQGYKLRMAR